MIKTGESTYHHHHLHSFLKIGERTKTYVRNEERVRSVEWIVSVNNETVKVTYHHHLQSFLKIG